MKGSIFSMKLYGHHQVSELNMSEHFLGSNKAFEILANLGLEPLIMLPSGRSPLYATKSSDEGQIILPSGRSPLYETKSSNEGQIMLA